MKKYKFILRIRYLPEYLSFEVFKLLSLNLCFLSDIRNIKADKTQGIAMNNFKNFHLPSSLHIYSLLAKVNTPYDYKLIACKVLTQ